MTICNVLSTISIGKNTAIVVDSSRDLFRNGTGILDEKGRPHEVISVGMDNLIPSPVPSDKVSLLVSGRLSTGKIYV